MRVLWLTPDKPADISVGRRQIAAHLAGAGIDVTLRGTTPRTVWTALREAGQYDVVIGTTRAGAIAGAALGVATHTPVVVDHVDPIRQFAATRTRGLAIGVRWLENRAFSVAEHVLYVYAEEASRVHRHATAATRTRLGVEYDRFASPDPSIVDRAREHLHTLGVYGPVLVYIGGLEPLYHIRALLGSVEYLEDWTLVVAGAGSLSAVVERAARDREDVVFLETVPHERVPGYLHAADVGACLVDDPHTLKLLEYAATGLPVVHLDGRTRDTLDGLVEFCEPEPVAVADATRSAAKRRDRATVDALQAFARRHRWREVAETYREVLEAVG